MKEKIELANKQWEDENEAKMLAKFEDIVNPGHTNAWLRLLFY